VRLAFHLNRFAGRSELGVTLAAAEDLPEPSSLTRSACTQLSVVCLMCGLCRPRDAVSRRCKTIATTGRWFSGDFDFDLLWLCFLALGQMDL